MAEDVALKVTVNNAHRFIVVIAKDKFIRDLISEIQKVSNLLIPGDVEITSVQSSSHYELPSIYKIGRLVKEGDSILAYSSDHKPNHDFSSRTALLGYSTSAPNHLGNPEKIGDKNVSKDFVQEDSVEAEIEAQSMSCYDEQQCPSKQMIEKDTDQTINTCKESGCRKVKTRKQKEVCEVGSSNDAEPENSCKRNENNASQMDNGQGSNVSFSELSKDLEHDPTDNEELEVMKQVQVKQNEDYSSQKEENKSKQNGNPTNNNKGKQKGVNECRNYTVPESEDRNQSVKQCDNNEVKNSIDDTSEAQGTVMKENSMTVNNADNDKVLTRGKGKSRKEPHGIFCDNLQKSTRQRKEKDQNVEVYSVEGQCPKQANDEMDGNRVNKTKQTVMEDFVLRLSTDNELLENTAKDSKELENVAKRKKKHSRTQSIDESLADDHHRNSAMSSSQPSSIVSEVILTSPAFKAMIESSGCRTPRRRQAIENSVTKVATWLADQEEENEDNLLSKQKQSGAIKKLKNATVDQHVVQSLNNFTKSDKKFPVVFIKDKDMMYPVVDVLPQKKLYFDFTRESGRAIRRIYFSNCIVVIPKLKVTQEMLKGLKISDIERTVTRRVMEEQDVPILSVPGCENTNDKDCDCDSNKMNGSEDMFSDMKSLPSNSLDGNLETICRKKDDDSCSSTEILDKCQKATKEQSLPPVVNDSAAVKEAEKNACLETDTQIGKQTEIKRTRDVFSTDDCNAEEGSEYPRTRDKKEKEAKTNEHQQANNACFETDDSDDSDADSSAEERSEYPRTRDKKEKEAQKNGHQQANNACLEKDDSDDSDADSSAEEGSEYPRTRDKKEKEAQTNGHQQANDACLETDDSDDSDADSSAEERSEYPRTRDKKEKEAQTNGHQQANDACLETDALRDKQKLLKRTRDDFTDDDSSAEEGSEYPRTRGKKKKKAQKNGDQQANDACLEKDDIDDSGDGNDDSRGEEGSEYPQTKGKKKKKKEAKSNGDQAFHSLSQTRGTKKEEKGESAQLKRISETLDNKVQIREDERSKEFRCRRVFTHENSTSSSNNISFGKKYDSHDTDAAFDEGDGIPRQNNSPGSRMNSRKKEERKEEEEGMEEKNEGKRKKKKKNKKKNKKNKKNKNGVQINEKCLQFDLCNFTALQNEAENSDSMDNEGLKQKKSSSCRDKAIECERNKSKGINKSSEISQKPEKLESNKPVDQVKKSEKVGKVELQKGSKPDKRVDKPILEYAKSNLLTGREKDKFIDRRKKKTKRKEHSGDSGEGEHSEVNEGLRKKRNKKSPLCTYEKDSNLSQTDSNVSDLQHSLSSSGFERKDNGPVKDVLSWISKKISHPTSESTSKEKGKSKLLDLIEDDKVFNQTPVSQHSKPVSTPRSSSLGTRSFQNTPVGFTNTVPRISKKSVLTPASQASARRKRKRRDISPSEPRKFELTNADKELLTGGIKRLDKLLLDDSFW